ncbi:SdrD B-like domain-containing protein [Taibaiella lutea]|nr:SdrD B-like domain-containing protein [Taibaiella lutea]
MRKIMTGKISGARVMLFLLTMLSCGRHAMAHKVQMFTSSGCITIGQTVSIDAIITDAPASTYYNWQFKGTNGNWVCFTNGSNAINGQQFTVSGASAAGPANNAPQLNILNASAVLDNLSIRCLMRENASPCGAPSGTVYGGDDLNTGEVKTLRLRLAADPANCSISCTSNLLNNTDGYYGGLEAVTYVSPNSFTDHNFSTGAGASDFNVNMSGTGSFKVMNNPFAAYAAFAKFAPHSGNYQMVVKGNTDAASKAWYKTITVIPGQTYSFSVWAAKVDNTAPKIQLKANGVEIATALLPSANGTWQQLNGTYAVPPGVTSVTFAILDKNAATTAHNYVLDDICLVKTNEGVTIGDRVWFDVNKNGAQDAGEPGVNAVTVKLYYDGNGDNNADSVNPVQTAITNSTGAYSFTHVIAGKYFVQFTLPAGYTGFTTQDATGVPIGQNSAVNVTTGKTGTHNFVSDFLTKDAGLVKDLTISGKAFMDVNGLTDNAVNGTLISAASGTALYANLFKGTSFVSSAAVVNGLYTFDSLAGNSPYTIAISTVQATSASTALSVLPAGWLNTGENTGTSNANDGLPNGLLVVSIAETNVANANFGMQQRPHAGSVTNPAQVNPGTAVSITIPASSFASSDVSPGIVSTLKLITFPSDANSITVGTNTYYASATGIPSVCPTATCAVFPVTTGIAIAAPNGVPSGVIKIDPVNGAVTVPLRFVSIDNGNAQSTDTGTVNIPFVVPDLTPNITASPNVLHGATTFNVTVAVSEINNVATQGLVTVYIPKDSRVTFTFNQNLNTIGSSPATPLNNSIWTYNGTNSFYHIFTTNNVIAANNFSTFGFVATFNPGSTKGKYPMTATITSGSGKENNTTNNSDSEILSYFSN